MSEPIQNAAIEDVLSSIRRLVSEDTRREAPEETVRQPEKAPRLVLTPALRVAESAPSAEAETAGAGEDLSVSAVPDPEDLPAPEAAREQDMHGINDGAIQELVDEAFAGILAGDEADVAGAGDGAPAPWADPDKTTLFEAARVEILTNPVHVPEDMADAVEHPEPVAEETAEQAEPGVAAEGPDQTLASRFAAMEAVIASTPDQWEPDGDVGDDYAGTPTETMDWQDHVEEDEPADMSEPAEEMVLEAAAEELTDDAPEVPESAAEAPAGTEEAGDRDSVFADDTFLDEESLRELVADIVRQELQGALGERITRNVRKLVRREIHRALAAHDLD
jgi:hypothetical protein